jgi:hypothetical protein
VCGRHSYSRWLCRMFNEAETDDFVKNRLRLRVGMSAREALDVVRKGTADTEVSSASLGNARSAGVELYGLLSRSAGALGKPPSPSSWHGRRTTMAQRPPF